MMKPLVSICIPTYNGEKYLKECLDSVLSQAYSNIEIIVIDDCSKDNTCRLIEEYQEKDKRIRLFHNEINLGLVGNWNKCLQLAKGEWIKFVFQDDLITSDCIEKQVNAVKDHSFVVCDRQFIFDEFVPDAVKLYYRETLLTLKKLINTDKEIYLSPRIISDFAASHISLNFIGEPTAVLFKKSVVEKVNNFNEELTQICDFEYWLRITTLEGLVYIPEELVSFRIHADSTTSQNVISNTKFKPRYIDVILFAHDLLTSDHYKKFRRSISYFKKKKIELFIISKMQEAKSVFEKDNSLDPLFFEKLFRKYPALSNYYKPSLAAKLVYCTVKLRRKFRK